MWLCDVVCGSLRLFKLLEVCLRVCAWFYEVICMLRGLGRFREACWCMDLGSGVTKHNLAMFLIYYLLFIYTFF